MNKLDGYGYGVWLVVKNQMLISDLKHIPHVTIMCCMEKEEAKKLYNEIAQFMGTNFEVILHNICKLLPSSSYRNDESYYSSGFDCFTTDWSLFQKICEKYSGSFSYNPHLSYYYSRDIKDLKYKNYDEDYTLQFELHVVDITHENSTNWNVLN